MAFLAILLAFMFGGIGLKYLFTKRKYDKYFTLIFSPLFIIFLAASLICFFHFAVKYDINTGIVGTSLASTGIAYVCELFIFSF